MNRTDQTQVLEGLLKRGNLHLMLEDLASICEKERQVAHEIEHSAMTQGKDPESVRRLHANTKLWTEQAILLEVASKHAEQNLIDHEKTPG